MSDKPKEEKEQYFDPWDGEYIGNIWGWKVSIIAAFVIAFFLALYFWRAKVNRDNGIVPDMPILETYHGNPNKDLPNRSLV